MKLRKRALVVLPAALGIAAVSGVGPASAAPSNSPNDNASCVAQFAVFGNSLDHGLGGRIISYNARYFGSPQACYFF
jgi:hypothetical protein